MSDSPVTLRKEGNISIITIDDGKANVFGVSMTSALSAALDEIDVKEGAVVIEGRDGIYSGGFDLNVVRGTDPEGGRKMTIGGVNVALKAFDFPRPIVAAVTGHAIAMGAIFNMGIDWRIGASGNFKHGLNEIRAGLTLPIFALELPRFRLNPRMYQESAMHSRLYTPEEAIEAGFLDEVVDAGSVREAAFKKAEELSTLPNPNYAISKMRDRHQVKKYVADTLEADLDAIASDAAPFR
jgi:enoyl-CoA hydratase